MKKRKKMYKLTAASRLALVSGKAQCAQIQEEGGDPLVFVNGRFQTCKEREWSAGKKKKKVNQWQGRRTDEKRGHPYLCL